MNKFPSAFRPHQVRPCMRFALRVAVHVRAVLRIPLPGIAGVEQVLSALAILDAQPAQAAVQLNGGHAQALGYLRGGHARYRVYHLVRIRRPRLQFRNPLVPALQCLLHDEQRTRKDYLVRLVRPHRHVAPVLADSGEHSPVTHRRNALASGLRLSSITSYSPSSLTNNAFCFLPMVSEMRYLESTSSSNRWETFFANKSNIVHTSIRQNQGSPFSSVTVRISPNSLLLNIMFSMFVCFFSPQITQINKINLFPLCASVSSVVNE